LSNKYNLILQTLENLTFRLSPKRALNLNFAENKGKLALLAEHWRQFLPDINKEKSPQIKKTNGFAPSHLQQLLYFLADLTADY